MQVYAQKNYNEIQGINGKYRISAIGCFLTAFSNLLSRCGTDISPLQLNAFFRDRRVYIDVDDKILDDLFYEAVTSYNPHIVVGQKGSNSNPPHRNAIVKFKGVGTFGTHFCLVDRIEGDQVWVVDSYDGVVRNGTAKYGKVVAWATYVNTTPEPVTPPAAPQYDGDLITIQPGWGISHAAKNAGWPDWSSEARWATIATLNGSGDWRAYNNSLKPGQRIKVGKYVAPAPAPVVATPAAPAPTGEPNYDGDYITVQNGWGISHALKAAGFPQTEWQNDAQWNRVAQANGFAVYTDFHLKPGMRIRVGKWEAPAPVVEAPVVVAPEAPTEAPVEPTAPAANAWKDTYKDYKDNNGDLIQVDYIAQVNVDVYDHETKKQLMPPLNDGQNVHGAGEFKDGTVTYVRTVKAFENNTWTAIPKDFLKLKNPKLAPAPMDDSDIDDAANELQDLLKNGTTREKLIALVGTFAKILAKLNPLKRKQK